MGGMRKRNLVAAVLLIALGVGYAVLTYDLPSRNIENATGPSFFPWIVGTLLLVLSGTLLIQGILPVVSDKVPKAPEIPLSRYLIGLVVFVVYLAALPTLGFIAANIPLFACLMVIYGERRPLWVIGGSVIISLASFFVFRDVFQIRLPSGILEGLI